MSAIDFNALTSQDELSLDDILAIDSAGSEKGIYQRDMLDFIHSNKLGVPYNYTGKAAQSVKMGFESAKTALAKKDDVSAEDKASIEKVQVRVRKIKATEAGQEDQEFVFLVNTALVDRERAARSGEATPTQPAAPVANDETDED